MAKLIILDNGHGMETKGKRTPTLPNGQKGETGSNFMHESEFNRAVVKYLKEELERCGFKTLLVSPTSEDTPLGKRMSIANNAKGDLYVSIHANALNGVFGKHGGIETFVFPQGESKRIGTLIHNELLKGTQLRDRGVKDGSHLYVIKNTSMPSTLLELGFMDSETDYKHLLSDEYRRECAIEICKGICKAFNVPYKGATVSKTSTPSNTKTNDDKGIYRLMTGTFTSKSDAEKVMAQIKEKFGIVVYLKEEK